jgi:hypothetical protein
LKNVLCFDLDSQEIKSAQHARYDEGMNDFPYPPPNARLVRFAQRGEPFPAKAEVLEFLDIDVSENTFKDLRTLSVLAGGEDSHLWFVFSKIPGSSAYINDYKTYSITKENDYRLRDSP